MMSFEKIVWAAMTTCALLASCAEAPTETTGQAIMNGTTVAAGYRGAVQITGNCSGTAVRNDWVLTAAHCFGNSQLGTPSTVTVTMGASTALASAIILHANLDVALVRLATPLLINGSTTGWVLNASNVSAAALVGQSLDCVGSGNDTFSGGSGITRHANIQVTSADADGKHYRMDAPIGPTPIEWQGDDGGACFKDNDIAGVDGTCTVLPGGTVECTQVAAASIAGWFNDTLGISAVPGNNDRVNAYDITLTGAEATVAGSNGTATFDGLGSSCACSHGPNVWYRFVLTQQEVVYLDTAGSARDTVIGLTDATGNPLYGLCNDDNIYCHTGGFLSTYESRLATVLSAGTYYVDVGACSPGAFQLHLQHQPTNVASFFYQAQFKGDSTTSTLLWGANLTQGTCGGAGYGEDARWIVTCGGQASNFSVCPSDGGTWSRQNGSGVLHDSVMYLRSAQTGSEAACNDDGIVSGAPDCRGTGGDQQPYGSRLWGIVTRRGLNTLFVDDRGVNVPANTPMTYTLRYNVAL